MRCSIMRLLILLIVYACNVLNCSAQSYGLDTMMNTLASPESNSQSDHQAGRATLPFKLDISGRDVYLKKSPNADHQDHKSVQAFVVTKVETDEAQTLLKDTIEHRQRNPTFKTEHEIPVLYGVRTEDDNHVNGNQPQSQPEQLDTTATGPEPVETSASVQPTRPSYRGYEQLMMRPLLNRVLFPPRQVSSYRKVFSRTFAENLPLYRESPSERYMTRADRPALDRGIKMMAKTNPALIEQFKNSTLIYHATNVSPTYQLARDSKKRREQLRGVVNANHDQAIASHLHPRYLPLPAASQPLPLVARPGQRQAKTPLMLTSVRHVQLNERPTRYNRRPIVSQYFNLQVPTTVATLPALERGQRAPSNSYRQHNSIAPGQQKRLKQNAYDPQAGQDNYYPATTVPQDSVTPVPQALPTPHQQSTAPMVYQRPKLEPEMNFLPNPYLLPTARPPGHQVNDQYQQTRPTTPNPYQEDEADNRPLYPQDDQTLIGYLPLVIKNRLPVPRPALRPASDAASDTGSGPLYYAAAGSQTTRTYAEPALPLIRLIPRRRPEKTVPLLTVGYKELFG